MKARLNFLIRYFLFWITYFLIFRLVFLIYQFHFLSGITFHDYLLIFIRGMWMDASLAGYALLLSSILIAVLFWSSSKIHKIVFRTVTLVLLTIFSIVTLSDLELYRNWGYRIDATPLLYLKTPKEAMASVPTWQIIVFIALLAGVVYLLFMAYRKLVEHAFNGMEKGKWWYVPVYVFVASVMIIPIRGGFGIAPMNPGKVYFSNKVFCNHAALNPVWNMMYSASKSGVMNKRYDLPIDKDKENRLFAKIMESDSTIHYLNTSRPNVLLILMESFTAKLIGSLGGIPGVTPNIDSLSKEGILFTRMYSTGDRSDKGIIGVLAGFPAQPTQSIIKYPTKSRKLSTVSGELADSGYSTTFYYGGDPDFANIRSFLYHAKFKRIVTEDNFPVEYRNSKWGVHDSYVFDYLLHDIDTAKGPFFKMYFTLSSHEPFETTMKQKFPGNDELHKYMSSVYYTDSCIGNFIRQARKRDWYKNTLIILIADHGHREPYNEPNYVVRRFHIPMLWLGGALNANGVNIDRTSSQTDLASTLLNQLNLSDSAFVLSQNILSKSRYPFAYFAFSEGYGFVTDADSVVYDLVRKAYIQKSGVTADSTAEMSRAFFNKYQDIFLGL
ncbi:MAG: sulfatase-like hydrolase/transferase [Bacteroidales bacterium]|nr:sulfatase-like hydrolase/transferase [Bacteroidales bacterium]